MTASPGLLNRFPSGLLHAGLVQIEGWPQTRDEFVSGPQRVLGKKNAFSLHRLLSLSYWPLTLLAAFGIAGALLQIAEDPALDLTLLVTVAFAAFLAYGVWGRLRSLLAPRFRTASRDQATPSLPLAGQPAAVVLRQTTYQASRRGVAAVRSRRAAERLVPVLVLLIGAAGATILIGLVAYGVVQDPSLELDLLLGVVTAGLAAFGVGQFTRALSRAGWRGSPMSLIRRAFYDSNRLYSSANSLTQLGISGAATAVVVAAGVGPIAFPGTPPLTLFGFDVASQSLYNVAPEDGSVLTFPVERDVTGFSPMGAAGRQINLADGSVVSQSAALTVATTRQGQFLAAINVVTGQTAVITRIQGTVDVAGIAAAPQAGGLFLVERTGRVLNLDVQTGATFTAGDIGRTVDVAGYDPVRKQFLALSGAEVLVVDLARLQATPVAAITPDIEACGVTGTSRGIVVADRATQTLFAFGPQGQMLGTVGPSPLGANVCGIVAVRR